MKSVYEVAKGYLGLKETPGPKANPTIQKFFKLSGHPEIISDEISWCAAFVNGCLAEAGLKGTGSLAARSFLRWGTAVDLKDAQKGDVVVIWRTNPNSWQGHVFFYEGQSSTTIKGLGGNQTDSVSIASFPKSRLLGVRRLIPAKPKPAPAPKVEAPPALKPVVGHPDAPWWLSILNAILAPFKRSFGGK